MLRSRNGLKTTDLARFTPWGASSRRQADDSLIPALPSGRRAKGWVYLRMCIRRPRYVGLPRVSGTPRFAATAWPRIETKMSSLAGCWRRHRQDDQLPHQIAIRAGPGEDRSLKGRFALPPVEHRTLLKPLGSVLTFATELPTCQQPNSGLQCQ